MPEFRVLDENEFLVAFIPRTQKALVYRVLSVANRGFERIDYGALPIESGTTLPTYDGGSTTVPEDGVLPARAYTSTSITFPLSGAEDENDMWYMPKGKDYANRLFHVMLNLVPEFIRIDVEIPKQVKQLKFQKDKITLGIDYNFGFRRGNMEIIHIPGIHYGYRFGNDTNMSVYTNVVFNYGEYIVEIPKDPSLIFDILTRRERAYWITLPINTYDTTIENTLLSVYGIDGFPLFSRRERDRALTEYRNLVMGVKV